jgi:hypothetical protein
MHLALPTYSSPRLSSLQLHTRLVSSSPDLLDQQHQPGILFRCCTARHARCLRSPTYTTRLPITVGGLTRKRVFNPNSSATHCGKSPTMADNSNGANESPAVAHDPPTDTSANKRKPEHGDTLASHEPVANPERHLRDHSKVRGSKEYAQRIPTDILLGTIPSLHSSSMHLVNHTRLGRHTRSKGNLNLAMTRRARSRTSSKAAPTLPCRNSNSMQPT